MLAHLNYREMARPNPFSLMINRPELSRSFPCPRSCSDSEHVAVSGSGLGLATTGSGEVGDYRR